VINTLQLATRKNLIQMSSDVITIVTVVINYSLLKYVHFRERNFNLRNVSSAMEKGLRTKN
jgi:hypothetical protein